MKGRSILFFPGMILVSSILISAQPGFAQESFWDPATEQLNPLDTTLFERSRTCSPCSCRR
jgi:hypothetical protein